MRDVSGGLRDRLQVRPAVLDALADGRPVVALESTLISHGFAYPDSREVALQAEEEVRQCGGVPATVAIRDDRILVGLSADEIEQLATAKDVLKASRPTLAAALAGGGWASTTVSATMLAAEAAGIRVFATGGIGGVHRGAFGAGKLPPTLDVSADVDELGRTEVCVVCAGPKLVLDVGLTMEALETRGVPVLTLGITEVPGFWSRTSGVPSPHETGSVDEVAAIVRVHLGLGLGTGMLVCVPVPEADAVPRQALEAKIGAAIVEAEASRVHGAALTPWLLARLAESTGGETVRANKSLIRNNARVAAEIAKRL